MTPTDNRSTGPPQPPLVSILRQGGYLIASIHTALDDTQLRRFQRDLIDRVGRDRARGIIIDVAALDVLDSFASHTLSTIANTARLRGRDDRHRGHQPRGCLRDGATRHPVGQRFDCAGPGRGPRRAQRTVYHPPPTRRHFGGRETSMKTGPMWTDSRAITVQRSWHISATPTRSTSRRPTSSVVPRWRPTSPCSTWSASTTSSSATFSGRPTRTRCRLRLMRRRNSWSRRSHHSRSPGAASWKLPALSPHRRDHRKPRRRPLVDAGTNDVSRRPGNARHTEGRRTAPHLVRPADRRRHDSRQAGRHPSGAVAVDEDGDSRVLVAANPPRFPSPIPGHRHAAVLRRRPVPAGSAFGVHQALGQAGALAGRLLLAAVLAWDAGDYRLAFGGLIAPGMVVLALLVWLRRRGPDPGACLPTSAVPDSCIHSLGVAGVSVVVISTIRVMSGMRATKYGRGSLRFGTFQMHSP